jgi:hypothetical protein
MDPGRMFLILATSVSLAAPPSAASAAAQVPDGPEAHSGSGDEGGPGMRGGMRGVGRMSPPDPVVLNGPPAPAEFARIVELPPDRVDGYARLYERFMSSTRPPRDSLAAMRRDLRDAFEQGDREAAQRHRGGFRPLAEELERRQAAFDEALQPMLAKDQWKRYQHWRDEQRKQAEKERQQWHRRPA